MPGFWSPIEFSIQPPVSAIRGGGFPSRGSGVTVFVTNASRLRATSGAVSASRQPLAFRSGIVAVDHCSTAHGATTQPGEQAQADRSCVLSDFHNAAIAGAVSASHRRLPRELRAGSERPDGLEHRLRAAREDVSRVVREQLGDELRLDDDLRLRAAVRAASACRSRPEAEDRRRGRRAPPRGTASARSRSHRRRAAAAPPRGRSRSRAARGRGSPRPGRARRALASRARSAR